MTSGTCIPSPNLIGPRISTWAGPGDACFCPFGRSARTLIVHDPLHFFENILVGYGNFSLPSTEYEQLAPDREQMATHAAIWRVLTGFPLARLVDRSLPVGTSGSLFLVLIPLGL